MKNEKKDWTKRKTLLIDPKLHRELKVAAVIGGVTVSAMVEAALWNAVRKANGHTTRKTKV